MVVPVEELDGLVQELLSVGILLAKPPTGDAAAARRRLDQAIAQLVQMAFEEAASPPPHLHGPAAGTGAAPGPARRNGAARRVPRPGPAVGDPPDGVGSPTRADDAIGTLRRAARHLDGRTRTPGPVRSDLVEAAQGAHRAVMALSDTRATGMLPPTPFWR